MEIDGFYVQQGQEIFIVGKQCAPTVSSTHVLFDNTMDLNRDTMDEDTTSDQLIGADKDVPHQSFDEGMPFGLMDKPGKIDQLESERVLGNNIQVPLSNRPQPSKQHELQEVDIVLRLLAKFSRWSPQTCPVHH